MADSRSLWPKPPGPGLLRDSVGNKTQNGKGRRMKEGEPYRKDQRVDMGNLRVSRSSSCLENNPKRGKHPYKSDQAGLLPPTRYPPFAVFLKVKGAGEGGGGNGEKKGRMKFWWSGVFSSNIEFSMCVWKGERSFLLQSCSPWVAGRSVEVGGWYLMKH